LQCSNGCRRDKGRCMSTWTRAPLPDGERMLTCLGPIGATCMLRGAPQPKPPRSLERRTQRRLAPVSAARSWAARKQQLIPWPCQLSYTSYCTLHGQSGSLHCCRGSRCTSSPALGQSASHIAYSSEHHHYRQIHPSSPTTRDGILRITL
jgi:hypothetical protein